MEGRQPRVKRFVERALTDLLDQLAQMSRLSDRMIQVKRWAEGEFL